MLREHFFHFLQSCEDLAVAFFTHRQVSFDLFAKVAVVGTHYFCHRLDFNEGQPRKNLYYFFVVGGFHLIKIRNKTFLKVVSCTFFAQLFAECVFYFFGKSERKFPDNEPLVRPDRFIVNRMRFL